MGARWQHRFFYALIRIGGRRAAYAFLRLVAAWYVLARPSERRKTRFYLDRRFPERGGGKRMLDSYRMITSYGEVLIDRAVVGVFGPQRVSFEFESRAGLLELIEAGRGLIIVQAHVGCWQVAMAALGHLGRPVHMLMRREDGDVDRQWFEHAGIPQPYAVIDPDGYLGGTIEMIGALRRGEVVCVMGDRVFGSSRGALTTEFLDRQAPFPYGPYKLAAAAGSPVAVLLSAKTGPESYRLELAAVMHVPQGSGQRPEAFRPFVKRFATVLESYAREHPWQFFNFYDLWSPSSADPT